MSHYCEQYGAKLCFVWKTSNESRTCQCETAVHLNLLVNNVPRTSLMKQRHIILVF